MKRFVIGDIHGNIKALKQVIERSNIDKKEDLLITLGDITDGHPYVFECVEELLTFENRIDIMGNHDEWFIRWIRTGVHPDGWQQGGYNTVKSYVRNVLGREVDNDFHLYITGLNPADLPSSHYEFFMNQRKYYKDDYNNVFIHGGFYRLAKIDDQSLMSVIWDRDLWYEAQSVHKTDVLRFAEEPLNKVFIGHTSTTYTKGNEEARPLFRANRVWNIDTGAGGRDKLTIMNVDTEEYFQSDKTMDLYEVYEGR